MTKYYLSTRIFFLFVTLLTFACKKNNDNKTYVLSNVYTDGNLRTSYEYNDQHQVIRSIREETRGILFTTETAYSYNNDGRLIRTVQTYFGQQTSHTSIEYEYNTEGRLVAEMYFNDDNNHSITRMVEYNYSGNTITKTASANGSINEVTVFSVNERGNIVKAVYDDRRVTNYDQIEEWSDYDNKKNIAGPYAGDVTSKNNPAQYVKKYTYKSEVSKYTYRYEYNMRNYVTRLKTFGSLGNNSISSLSRYEYIPVN